MNRLVLPALSLLAGLAPDVAAAQAPLHELRDGNRDMVFVWKDAASFREAEGYFAAGTNRARPDLVMRLQACGAFAGSPVAVVERGRQLSMAAVVEGPAIGCRGVVETAHVVPLRPREPLPPNPPTPR